MYEWEGLWRVMPTEKSKADAKPRAKEHSFHPNQGSHTNIEFQKQIHRNPRLYADDADVLDRDTLIRACRQNGIPV